VLGEDIFSNQVMKKSLNCVLIDARALAVLSYSLVVSFFSDLLVLGTTVYI
jgi:hypothetical protein